MKSKSVLRFAVLAALVGGVFLSGASSADAGFSLTLKSTGAAVVVQDNGVGDIDSSVGTISFNGTVAGFGGVQTTVGTSNSQDAIQPATLSINELALGKTGNTLTLGKTLTITLEDTAYTVPDATNGVNIRTDAAITQTGTPRATLSHTSYLGGDAITNISLTSGTSGSQTKINGGFIPSGPEYSLKSVTVITVTKGGSGQIQVVAGMTVATPEPATVVSAIIALPVLGMGTWFRRRKQS